MELKTPRRLKAVQPISAEEVELERLRRLAHDGYLLGYGIGLKRGFRRGIWAGVAIAVSAGLVCASLLAGTANAQSLETKVTWHIMPSVDAARKKCLEVLGGGTAISCARWSIKESWCEIWAIDPTTMINNDYHERVFGHEGVHCFKGDYHKGRPN